MATIHILNQYIWPDGSPVCLYAEALANDLHKQGKDVVMVGGSGIYRSVIRPKPAFRIHKLTIPTFPRNSFFQILKEYFFVFKATKNYLDTQIKPGDTLVVTSSPFTNLFFILFINHKSIKTIFWLFDFFPDSLISVNQLYILCKPILNFIWLSLLHKYDQVIKISENMNYRDKNCRTFRLWPTLKINSLPPIKPKKWVLYSGNLGITHDVKSLITIAKKFYDQGYEIHFYADGPKARQLPSWIKHFPILKNESDYINALLEHEIHLITGTPNNSGGSFPSKIRNSIAANRQIIPCGFHGAMLTEFDYAKKSDFRNHQSLLTNFILNHL